MSELHDLTALEQSAAIRGGETSSTELVEHYLARIDSHSASIGAFVTVTAAAARERARAMDDAGRDGTGSPLAGVPIGIKDLNFTAGVRTTLGSRIYADFVPPFDDNVVTLLRQAGTISLGKTNAPEFGLPCYTENGVAPPARTPWDLSRSAGGSSGGAGAAVAAGLIPVAQGSDGGGSIRIPASVCGLVGLKCARGRVSSGPLGVEATGLSGSGPIGRSVADVAALLDAMAVPMPGDPHWAPPLPAGQTFLGETGREVGALRIGRHITPPVRDAEIAPEVRAAWEDASALLASLGHQVDDVPAPFGPDLLPMFEVLWAVAACSAPVEPSQEAELAPLTRWMRERGRRLSANDFTTALGGVQAATRQAIADTAAYDAILTPTLAQLPAPIGWFTDGVEPAEDFERQKRFTPFTALYNVSGQPAISLPLYWTEPGLPVGIMLAGRPADEATLLALGAQLEATRPWRDRHPAIW